MMNVMSYLTGLFRGQALDDQLTDVRRAARHDAEVVVGTYAREFEAAAARILSASQELLIGDGQSIEDAEWEPDYSSWSRPALMREAKDRGLVVKRTDTAADLVAKLKG